MDISKRPCLNELILRGELQYVDYALAEAILSGRDAGEESAAFLCYLSLASRKGHLCVYVDETRLDPDPQILFTGEINTYLKEFRKHILEGVHSLPKDLVRECPNAYDQTIPVEPICRHGNYYYFQRLWVYETQFLFHFRQLQKAPLALKFDTHALYENVSKKIFQNTLMPEQAAAILRASEQTLTLVCGGPGTGKTYTAGQLIHAFWEVMSEEQRQRCQIAIAAPTGKAAANLQKSLTAAAGSCTALRLLTAKTLHSLLGIRESGRKRNDIPSKLSADLVLVDECSMIDAKLMGELLKAIKPGARLILLGDKHQLPPVDAGSLFADMMTLLEKEDQKKRPSELKVCLRAELKGIVDFAHLVNSGNAEEAWKALTDSTAIEGVSLLTLKASVDKVHAMQKALVDYAFPFFPKPGQAEHALDALLEKFNKFRVLSPLRKGPFGVDELNRLFLKKALKHVPANTVFVAPIMLTSSQSKLELFNGEVGILVRHRISEDLYEMHFNEGDYALFPHKTAEGAREWRKVPALTLPAFEYAYCLSVYKSQGSEFENVLLLMPQGSEGFGREVLYTAVTRARRKLEIWEQNGIVKETIRRQSRRLSGILK